MLPEQISVRVRDIPVVQVKPSVPYFRLIKCCTKTNPVIDKG